MENRHKNLLTLLYFSQKWSTFRGDFNRYSIDDERETSDLATFRNVEFYVKCCNPWRFYWTIWLHNFHCVVKASVVTVSADCGKTVNHGGWGGQIRRHVQAANWGLLEACNGVSTIWRVNLTRSTSHSPERSGRCARQYVSRAGRCRISISILRVSKH